MAWLPSILRGANATKTPDIMQQQDATHDDDWTNISINEDSALASSLLLHMPSLFNKALPPCGLLPQIAYENINQRLRTVWLQHAAEHQDARDLRVLDICTAIEEEIGIENAHFPPGRLRYTKLRQPWRSEDVFRYEIAWARYFVEEARVLESWAAMTESERDRQSFMFKLYPIPPGLQIHVKNAALKRGVLNLWVGWHNGKRADLRDLIETLDAEAEEEEGRVDGKSGIAEVVTEGRSDALVIRAKGQDEQKDEITVKDEDVLEETDAALHG